MDSAETREKAKNQTSPDDLMIVPVARQDPARDVEPGQPEQRHAVDADEESMSLAIFEDNAVALQSANERIDRLFAATDDCALTAADFFKNILDNQEDFQTQASRQYLAFQLGNEEYALDINRISEIIKVREFTGIPRAPQFLLGIISLRGVVVPVFDLRRRLHLGASAILPTSRVVISQLDDATVGLLVDGINQVVILADDELEPPPEVLPGHEREMVSGVGRYQGRMIIILNLHNALNGQLH